MLMLNSNLSITCDVGFLYLHAWNHFRELVIVIRISSCPASEGDPGFTERTRQTICKSNLACVLVLVFTVGFESMGVPLRLAPSFHT